MKKLLSLLSVLTISGTAISTTIAASPYQKEETIKNSDINSQINNLKINRNKRENNRLIWDFDYNKNESFNGNWTNDLSQVNWKIDYSKYANSWEDLIENYSKINIIGNVTARLWDGDHNENNLTIPLTNFIPGENSAGSAAVYNWINCKVFSGLSSQKIILQFFFTKNNKFLYFGIQKEVDSFFSNKDLWYKYNFNKIIIE